MLCRHIVYKWPTPLPTRNKTDSQQRHTHVYSGHTCRTDSPPRHTHVYTTQLRHTCRTAHPDAHTCTQLKTHVSMKCRWPSVTHFVSRQQTAKDAGAFLDGYCSTAQCYSTIKKRKTAITLRPHWPQRHSLKIDIQTHNHRLQRLSRARVKHQEANVKNKWI